MSDSMKLIQIVEFNDKEDEYRIWVRQFMFVATTRGYQDVILKKMTVPPQDGVLDKNLPNVIARLKGRKENKKA